MTSPDTALALKAVIYRSFSSRYCPSATGVPSVCSGFEAMRNSRAMRKREDRHEEMRWLGPFGPAGPFLGGHLIEDSSLGLKRPTRRAAEVSTPLKGAKQTIGEVMPSKVIVYKVTLWPVSTFPSSRTFS